MGIGFHLTHLPFKSHVLPCQSLTNHVHRTVPRSSCVTQHHEFDTFLRSDDVALQLSACHLAAPAGKPCPHRMLCNALGAGTRSCDWRLSAAKRRLSCFCQGELRQGLSCLSKKLEVCLTKNGSQFIRWLNCGTAQIGPNPPPMSEPDSPDSPHFCILAT